MATQDQIIVSPVETENDLTQANYCVSEAFGRQTKDAVWMLMNPGWDTEAGQKLNAQTLIKRWRSTTTNKDGNPNTIFLKATLPHPSKDGERKVVGMAIWAQQSYVEGYGDPFVGDMKEALNILEGRCSVLCGNGASRTSSMYLSQIASPQRYSFWIVAPSTQLSSVAASLGSSCSGD
jgi:hypothetical protein